MSIKREISPCWQCELRAPNCHAVCLKYEAYRLTKDKDNELLRKQMQETKIADPELAYEKKKRSLRRKKDAQNRGRHNHEKG